jgi:alanine-glyoxylate transaminase/serine-glyoxylate transaminase/serine-pyruvate transaminase
MTDMPSTARVRRGRSFLHTPGPTTVPDRVLRAMNRPMVDLADPDFIALTRSVIDDLAPVFRTEGEVFAYAANGHGAWEAALANTLSPGDAVLVPQNGHFSDGWMRLAASLGLEPVPLDGDWRRAIEPARITAVLAADAAQRIRAVLQVHTDTATGIGSDIPAVRRAMDEAGHPALLMVDAVASLATVDLRMDEWGVDVVVSASQKGLMSPPGLAFTAVGPRAVEAAARSQALRNYWDWERRRASEYYTWFNGTAPEHLVFALRESLDMLAEEGLVAAFARHARLAGAVRAAVEVWSETGAVEFNALEPRERANGVTTIRLAEPHDAREVIRVCRERFDVALGGGLGRLAGRCFRIAHMGWINEPMILGAVGCVEATLRLLGIPHGSGGTQAAIAALSVPPDNAPTR